MKAATIASQEITISNTQRAFINRMLLTLACICTRIPNGISILIQQFFDIMDPSFLSTTTFLGIELFSLIPSEVEAADVSHSLRIELQSQLNNELKRMLLLIQSIVSLVMNDTNYQHLRNLQIIALKLLRSWLMQGVTISILFQEYNMILKFLCDSLQSGDPLLVSESCSSLREIIIIEDTKNPIVRDETILKIIQHVTSTAPSLAPFFGINGDENVAHEICNFMVSIASNDITLLTTPQNCNLGFFDLLLSCTTLRPRKIAALTFDVWLGIQDQPVANRHIYLTQDIFFKLLTCLLNQCIYPVGFVDWDNCENDDEDDFITFRDQRHGNIQDVIVICCYSLQEAFFSPLQELLMKTDNDWRDLEVVLYIVQSAMDGIKGMIKSEGGVICLQFLFTLLQKCLLTNQHMNSLIMNALSKLIGSLTFLLISSPSASFLEKVPNLNFGQLYLPALQFTFNAISDSLSATSGAKALHQLCVQGSNFVTSIRDGGQLPMICELVDAANHVLMNINIIEDAPLLSLVEALTRNIVELPHELGKTQLNKLCKPIIDIMKHEVRKPIQTIDAKIIQKCLMLSSQIVRFCDISPDTNTGEHITQSLVIELFIQLEIIEKSFLMSHEISLIESIFELYGKIIMTRKDSIDSIDYINQIKRLTHNIIILVQGYSKSSSSAMQCSSIIVELLANKSPDANIFLGQFYQELLLIFINGNNNISTSHQLGGVIDINVNVQQQISKYEPECIEYFCTLLYNYILFLPDLLASSSNLHEIILVCISCLHVFKERTTIRSALQIIKSFFSPITKKMELYTTNYLMAGSVHGQNLIYELFQLMNNGSSSVLWPYLIDALYSIISGCDDGGIGLDCRQWIHNTLYSSFINIPIPSKTIIFNGIFRYVISNKKQFKSLMQDFIKICNSEASFDILGIYDDE